MARCKDCLYFKRCVVLGVELDMKHDKEADKNCRHFKNKADYVKSESVSEQIIRKQAEVSDYWKNDVKKYRAMQGYSDIEHDADNFLRGYNEAVEDMLAILDSELQKGETK